MIIEKNSNYFCTLVVVTYALWISPILVMALLGIIDTKLTVSPVSNSCITQEDTLVVVTYALFC